MAKGMWTVMDGPLEGNVFALEAQDDSMQFSFTLADGRVAIYKTVNVRRDYSGGVRYGDLHFVGIDPFA